MRALLVATVICLFPLPRLAAQDPFEITVYPAGTAGAGEWELETHLNHTARGVSRGQTRLTFEVTRGITAGWEASAYVLTSYQPGLGSEYEGWRLRSRVHAPDRWKLPLDVGFSAEFEAPHAALELTPILEKRFGAMRLGFNANFERELDADEGWEFEPSALFAYRLSSVATIRLEYHGSFGEIAAPLAGAAQVHQFFPGVDLHLGDGTTLGLSVGVGATTAGNRLVFASRFEIEL